MARRTKLVSKGEVSKGEVSGGTATSPIWNPLPEARNLPAGLDFRQANSSLVTEC